MNKTIEELSNQKSDIKPKIKIRVIDVMCFDSSYTCPYYGQFTDRANEHCRKCWHLTSQ